MYQENSWAMFNVRRHIILHYLRNFQFMFAFFFDVILEYFFSGTLPFTFYHHHFMFLASTYSILNFKGV